MSKELKQCPFCGGEAKYSKIDTSKTVPFGTVQHFVTCKNNCLEGLYARGNTKEEAIKAWNRRPSPWHTGTPTEEGWYIVAYKPYNRDDIGFGYEVFQFNGGCWYDSNDNWTDPFMVAWQKIEPFKESE